MFVSSHLMSEMALTADRLIIIGRGKLLADTTVDELTQASRSDVLVKSPRAEELSAALRGGRHRRNRIRRTGHAHRHQHGGWRDW